VAKDLRASQLQTTQIISSGSSSTNARIVMYDVDAQSTASPNQGVIDTGKFDTSGIGNDVFLYVSGGIGEKDGSTNRISVFGGDLHISGNLSIDGSGGGGADTDWTESGTELRTTSSVAISTVSEFASAKGTDVYFYASGTIGAKDSSTRAVGLFGGDLHISGNLTVDGTSPGGGGASGLWTADGTGTEIRVTSSVAVSTVSEFASAKGTDVFFYASGTIGAKDSSVRAVGLFGGDLHISGNLTVDGTSPGGSSQANQLQVGIVDYATTSTTSSTTVGQITFTGSEYSGSIYLSALVSATAAAVSSSIRLYNLDDFAYVAIGGGSQEHLGAASTTPTKLTSVDLKSAANFNAISSSNYELQVSSSSESTIVTIGASAFLVTGVVSLASEHLSLGSYTLSTATSSNPQVVGGGYLVPSEHSLNSVIFRSILSTTTGSDAAIVQLYNLTSGALVHIGGASSTQISTSSITPANVQSVELTTATNFDLTTPSVYEVRVFGSGSASPITVIHNSEFVFT